MGPPVVDLPEPTAAAAPASASSEPATESAWERGLRHAKEVSVVPCHGSTHQLRRELLCS